MIENQVKTVFFLSAYLRLCNISVVKFLCPTYTFYSNFLKINYLFFYVSWSSCDTVPLKVIIVDECY